MRDANVELDSVETRMGKKTIELHHISKSFGERKILDDFNYIVLRNQRLVSLVRMDVEKQRCLRS